MLWNETFNINLYTISIPRGSEPVADTNIPASADRLDGGQFAATNLYTDNSLVTTTSSLFENHKLTNDFVA